MDTIDNSKFDSLKINFFSGIMQSVDDHLESQVSTSMKDVCENTFGRLLTKEALNMIHQMEYDIFAEKRNGRRKDSNRKN